MKQLSTQKGFVIPLVIAIVVILAAGGVYYAAKSSLSSKNTQLSEKESLDIAQTTFKGQFGADFKMECVDFDGIKEGNAITYSVGYKPAEGCTPSLFKEPATVTINLTTGTSSIVTGHPITAYPHDGESNSALKTYADSKNGFSLKYPSQFALDMAVQKTGYYDYQITNVAKLTNKETGIDFATLTISIDPNTQTKCYTASTGPDAHEATQTKVINGNTFRVFVENRKDAAMGGVRGSQSEYRIMHNGNCYILNALVTWHEVGFTAYANTGKSDATPAQVQAQNNVIEKNIAALNDVISSFAFTASALVSSANSQSSVATEWKIFTNEKDGYQLSYPSNWQANMTSDGSIWISNPARQGKSDTDQPSEGVRIPAISMKTLCTESAWKTGLGSVNYKTHCYESGVIELQLNAVAFDDQAKVIEDKIIASVKYKAPSSVTVVSPISGKIYNNTRFNFQINYPSDWQAMTRGSGEAIAATGNEDIFSIVKSNESVMFDIAALGSDRLGSAYASAKNVQQYLNLLKNTDQNGKAIRTLTSTGTFAGETAYFYEGLLGSGSMEIYFQKGNYIYNVRITPYGPVSERIASSLKFSITN